MSAFMFFSQAIREKIKEDLPDIKNTEYMGESSTRWKALSEEDKKSVAFFGEGGGAAPASPPHYPHLGQ
jgi:hypothetical protein